MKIIKIMLFCLVFQANSSPVDNLQNFIGEAKGDTPIYPINYNPDFSSLAQVVLKDGKPFYLNEIVLLENTLKKLPFLSEYVEKLTILDPFLSLGSYFNLDDIGFYVAISSIQSLGNGQGIGLKLFLDQSFVSGDVSSSGILSAYYFYNHGSLFQKNDFVSFYVGYFSDKIKVDVGVDLNNFDWLFEKGKSVLAQQERVKAGFHYIPKTKNKLGITGEAGVGVFSLGVSYDLN